MDLIESARLDWQRAQADLQIALADLEKNVAGSSNPEMVVGARDAVARRQKIADELLNRYITQLGKS